MFRGLAVRRLVPPGVSVGLSTINIASAKRLCSTQSDVAAVDALGLPLPSTPTPDGKVRIRFLLTRAEVKTDEDDDVDEELMEVPSDVAGRLHAHWSGVTAAEKKEGSTTPQLFYKDVYTYPDDSLKDVAEGTTSVDITAACGGTCKCSTCQVYLYNGSRYSCVGDTCTLVKEGDDGQQQGEGKQQLLLVYPNQSPIIDVPPPDVQELDMLDLALGRDEPLRGIVVAPTVDGADGADKGTRKGGGDTPIFEGSSRLSCQITVTEEMDGLIVRVAPGQVDVRFTVTGPT